MFIPKATMADIAHDQSIGQITSDSYNDVRQNEAEIKKDTQVFDLNEVEGITSTGTVFNEEDLEMGELINEM